MSFIMKFRKTSKREGKHNPQKMAHEEVQDDEGAEDTFLKKYEVSAQGTAKNEDRLSECGSCTHGSCADISFTVDGSVVGRDTVGADGCSMSEKTVSDTSSSNMMSSQKVLACTVTNHVKYGSTDDSRKLPSVPDAIDSTTNGDRISTHTPEVSPRQSLVSGGGGGGGGGIGTARYRALKSGNMVTSIPEEEITIPNDGNLASFSADAMATFLRYLRLDDRLVNHMHRNGLDGRRFGRLKNSDLDNLKLSNPVLVYFRGQDCSCCD